MQKVTIFDPIKKNLYKNKNKIQISNNIKKTDRQKN